MVRGMLPQVEARGVEAKNLELVTTAARSPPSASIPAPPRLEARLYRLEGLKDGRPRKARADDGPPRSILPSFSSSLA